MPKSKRDRPIFTSKTTKKSNKAELIESVQETVETSNYTYVFEVENFRNNLMQPVRKHWRGSKFIFGKNTVIQLALGKTQHEEIRPKMAQVSQLVTGGRGLFCTGVAPEEVKNYFENFQVPEFARAGFVATEDFRLQAGPLDTNRYPFSMKETLRVLGLPVKLDKGVVVLEVDHTVCEKGDCLTPEQARLLKFWEVRQAVFRFNIVAYWHNDEIFIFPSKEEMMVEEQI